MLSIGRGVTHTGRWQNYQLKCILLSQFPIGQIQNGGSCTCVSDAETLFLKLKTGNPKDAFRKYYFAFLGTCVKWRNYPSESSFAAVRFFTRSSNAPRRKSRGNKTVCTHLWGHFIVVDVKPRLRNISRRIWISRRKKV